MKFKFDKDAVLEFGTDHIEKLVFALVLVCVALMVLSLFQEEKTARMAKGREGPSQLVEAADNARTYWRGTKAVAPEECNAPNYPEIVEVTLRSVDETHYRNPTVWSQPLFKALRLREEPPLFPVEKLRGIAGRAAFQLRTDPTQVAAIPDENNIAPPRHGRGQQWDTVRGQRWVVLTGCVPIKRYIQEFQEYFKDVVAADPRTDVPELVYYRVERAEVADPNETENLNWTRFSVRREVSRAEKRWSTGRPREVVDTRYIDDGERLVFPLGPRLPEKGAKLQMMSAMARAGGDLDPWARDESVAYPPDIPLLSPEKMRGFGGPHDTEREGAEPGDDDMILDEPLPNDMSRRIPRAEFEMFRDPMRRPGSGARTYRGSLTEESPKYWLLRFFDFTVEPGKQYRYRVRLVLHNPNCDVDDRYLSERTQAKKQEIEQAAKKAEDEGNSRKAILIRYRWKYLETDWSEPTDVVSVPRDTKLLAVSVKPPLRTGDAPSASVMMITWVESHGKEAYTKTPFAVVRGKVANFPGREFPPGKALKNKKKKKDVGEDEDFAFLGKFGNLADVGGVTKDVMKVDYLSEALVLDMWGGQRLHDGRLTAPGELLLHTPEGSLVVREELDDKAEYDAYVKRAEPEPSDEQRRFGPGMEGIYFDGVPRGAAPLTKPGSRGKAGSSKKKRPKSTRTKRRDM